ncbi:MAG: CHAP domain-containing protein [Chloroflexi bacterium]|nr:CHAP domain-containing protein [Chloroflexota bacterium]
MRRVLVAIALAATLVTSLAPLSSVEAAWNPFEWGQCTWWAADMRPDLIGTVWGNAWHWIYEARWGGFRTGYYPVRGAVVVFQRGVDGASWYYGHVAYVTAVGNNGWFQVSEMNFPWFGRVSYRWVHTGWGVSFIYW